MDKMDTKIKLPKSRPSPADEAVSEAIDRSQSERSALRGSWPFDLAIAQQGLTAYSDHERDIFISAYRWCTDPEHMMHLNDFAARVKSHANTLYKIFTGRYRYQKETIQRKGALEIRAPHPKAGQTCPLPEGLIDKIENFLALERKRVALGANDLVVTPMIMAIRQFCNLIREIQQMGWIVGPSHIGKTWGLQLDYTPSNNHGRTIYVRLPAGAGRREVFGAIWQAMSNSSTKGTVDELKFKIKNGLTRDMLLILDEVHLLYHHARPNVFFKVLDEIRELHDVKKAAIILVFTWLPDDMRAAQDKQLQQVFRRAPRKLHLPKMPAKEDLKAILEHNGLNFPDKKDVVTLKFETEGADGKPTKEVITEQPYELLRQLAKNEALLAITERIRAAKVIANAKRKPVAWEHFVEAHLEIAAQAEAEGVWE
jgi:hypothetical protein